MTRTGLVAFLVLSYVSRPAVADDPSKAIGVRKIRAADHVGEARYALLVGIDEYKDDRIPKLPTCEADARQLYQVLTDPQIGGLDLQNAKLLVGVKATAQNIRHELSELSKLPQSRLADYVSEPVPEVVPSVLGGGAEQHPSELQNGSEVVALARIMTRPNPPEKPMPKPEESKPEPSGSFGGSRAGQVRDDNGLKTKLV